MTLGQIAHPEQKRKAIQQLYLNELKHYRSERVGVYLGAVGLKGDYAWCAAFVSWCFEESGFVQPRTPWSPSLFPQSRRIWQVADGNPQVKVQRGDVFGIYIHQKKRIGHVGFVDGVDGSWLHTVEGNTSDPAGRGPMGLYRRRRPWRTISVIADWIKGNENNIFFNP